MRDEDVFLMQLLQIYKMQKQLFLASGILCPLVGIGGSVYILMIRAICIISRNHSYDGQMTLQYVPSTYSNINLVKSDLQL